MSADSRKKKILIKLVSNYKCLYDATSRNNSNKPMRDLAWMEITNILSNADAKIAEPAACWKSLRSNFTRQHKVGNTNWPYFEEMMFLEPYIRHRDDCAVPLSSTAIHTWKCVPNMDQPSTSSGYFGNVGMETYFVPTNDGDMFTDDVADYEEIAMEKIEELDMEVLQEVAFFSKSSAVVDGVVVDNPEINEDIPEPRKLYKEQSNLEQAEDASIKSEIINNSDSNMSWNEETIPEVDMKEEPAEFSETNFQVPESNEVVIKPPKKCLTIAHLDEDIIPLRCLREKIPDRRNDIMNIIHPRNMDSFPIFHADGQNVNLTSVIKEDVTHTFQSTSGSADMRKSKEKINLPVQNSRSTNVHEGLTKSATLIHHNFANDLPRRRDADTTHRFETPFGSADVRKRKEKRNHPVNSDPVIVNKVITKPVVPKLDKFAKKKKKSNQKQQNDCEAAISRCSESFLKLNKKSMELLTEQTLETRERRSELLLRNRMLPVQQLQMNDGFLNLIREEWSNLNTEEMKEVFNEVLDIMEDNARN